MAKAYGIQARNARTGAQASFWMYVEEYMVKGQDEALNSYRTAANARQEGHTPEYHDAWMREHMEGLYSFLTYEVADATGWNEGDVRITLIYPSTGKEAPMILPMLVRMKEM